MRSIPLHPPAHDPRAPHARVQSGDVASAKDAFLDRLRELGAADDVVASVDANWDDPEWVERPLVVAMADDDLRAELAAIEREYHEGTTTEEEDALAERAAVEADAAAVIDEHHATVAAWVRDDPAPPARAVAMEHLEAQREHPRPSVLEACAEIIAEAEAGE